MCSRLGVETLALVADGRAGAVEQHAQEALRIPCSAEWLPRRRSKLSLLATAASSRRRSAHNDLNESRLLAHDVAAVLFCFAKHIVALICL